MNNIVHIQCFSQYYDIKLSFNVRFVFSHRPLMERFRTCASWQLIEITWSVVVEQHVLNMHASTGENVWIITMFILVTAARLHFMVTSVSGVSFLLVMMMVMVILSET